jgi:hypothetical protein
MKLEKVIVERTDAINRSKSFQSSLQIAEDELKHSEEQNEQHQQEIQQFAQSIDEQRSFISDFENKFQVFREIYQSMKMNFISKDSQTRCTELENEKQRIQSEFDEFYQRTHHLESIQVKNLKQNLLIN